jgi:hypothetical protein
MKEAKNLVFHLNILLLYYLVISHSLGSEIFNFFFKCDFCQIPLAKNYKKKSIVQHSIGVFFFKLQNTR